MPATERSMRKEQPTRQSAQELQDDVFRRMSAEEKIHLASSFFRFAQLLKAAGTDYGARNTPQKNRGAA